MNQLDQLESKSIYLLREAYSQLNHLCMLWSIGKDSTVLLWLARKAFFGHVPFPLVHVDTSYKIPEMIEYRNKFAKDWNLTLLVGKNEAALDAGQTFPAGTVDRGRCCQLLKTKALSDTLNGTGKRYVLNHQTNQYELFENNQAFTGVVVGIRSDEEGSRSKERYFSLRGANHDWDVSAQPPEFWNQYKTDFPPNSHVRVHPLLDWTELNIWEYIEREKIPTVSLYYDQGQGQRYRSLGCAPCTNIVTSCSKNPEEIILEIKSGQFANISERSGRAQDKEMGGLETLRKAGYM